VDLARIRRLQKVRERRRAPKGGDPGRGGRRRAKQEKVFCLLLRSRRKLDSTNADREKGKGKGTGRRSGRTPVARGKS